MSTYRSQFEQRTTVVAKAATSSDADFVKVTLAAHGFQAAVSARSVVFPSVDFVEGFDVSVRSEDAEAARGILTALGLTGDDVD
jgi:hypothetical protein